MATTLEYLQSIVSLATDAQAALSRGDNDELSELLGLIRDDLDAAEKQEAGKS